jgi:hypothetical protein
MNPQYFMPRDEELRHYVEPALTVLQPRLDAAEGMRTVLEFNEDVCISASEEMNKLPIAVCPKGNMDHLGAYEAFYRCVFKAQKQALTATALGEQNHGAHHAAPPSRAICT